VQPIDMSKMERQSASRPTSCTPTIPVGAQNPRDLHTKKGGMLCLGECMRLESILTAHREPSKKPRKVKPWDQPEISFGQVSSPSVTLREPPANQQSRLLGDTARTSAMLCISQPSTRSWGLFSSSALIGRYAIANEIGGQLFSN